MIYTDYQEIYIECKYSWIQFIFAISIFLDDSPYTGQS